MTDVGTFDSTATCRSGSAAWSSDSRTPKEEPMDTDVKNVGNPAFLVREAPAFVSGRGL